MGLVGPIRCGLGGALLGVATIAAFSFVGVPVIPTDGHGLPLAAAGRPAPAGALLTAADLPPGFAPAPPTPAPPGADGCAALLANPAAGWAGAVRRQLDRPGAALWEAIATPAGDAVGRLRSQLLACPGVRDAGVVLSVPGGYLVATRVGTTVLALRYVGPPDPGLGVAAVVAAAVSKLRRADPAA